MIFNTIYPEQLNFLFILFFIIYIIFAFIFYRKKVSKIDFLFLSLAFWYIFWLFVYSFFPLKTINLEYMEKMRQISLKMFEEEIYYFVNYEVRFSHFLLFLPAWFISSYFIKNIKKSFFFWFFTILSIEILQFIFTKISIYFGYWVYRTFKIEDIFINFLWFLFWIIIFIVSEKIIKNYKIVKKI